MTPSTKGDADTYFQDSRMEVSGSGPRAVRKCSLVLKPDLTLGGANAPRLVLNTSGLNRISIEVANSDAYWDLETVFENTRQPIGSPDQMTLEQFSASYLGIAIKARKLLFVTGRRGDSGRYVSSRYDGIDFDDVLAKLETYCPFDAESLMSDLSAKERGERILGIGQADLTLIRWALDKTSGRPDARSSLTQEDRDRLRRYTAANDLPVSRFLTAQSAQRLKAEGALLAEREKPFVPPPPPPPPPPTPVVSEYFTFKLCNKSRMTIAVATSSLVSPSSDRWKVEGWWILSPKKCHEREYPKGWFYFYGEKRNSGGSTYWGRKDLMLCVNYPGPFERINTAGYTCREKELKPFRSVFISSDTETYEFNFN